jgi:exonuclease VII small subunit
LPKKAYLSDVFAPWSIAQQELVLAGAIEGWPNGVAVYRDCLDRFERRARRVESLIDRDEMLRPTTRKDANQIYVASLAVLAWDENDFKTLVEIVLAGNGVILSIDDKIEISNDTPLRQAIAAWDIARKRSRSNHVKSKAAKISAEKKKAIAALGVARIKPFWGLSAEEWPTPLLRQMAGRPGKPIAYNTIVEHLGVGRAVARKRHQAMLKRRATLADKELVCPGTKHAKKVVEKV